MGFFVNDFFVGLRPNSLHGIGVGTINVPEGSSMVMIQPIGNNVRVMVDGTTSAGASAGFQVASGTTQFFPVAGSKTISIVAEAGSPSVQYQFFK